MASSTTEIISGFENEQKSTVFSALSEYLSTGLFVDISLVCKGQILRAHKEKYSITVAKMHKNVDAVVLVLHKVYKVNVVTCDLRIT